MSENNIKPFTAEKAKVLIVDDSNVTLKIEEDLMKTYGMDVTTAKSGKECIALLNSYRYDIIFMDHMMPDMDGIETTQKIRKMNGVYFKNVIIIALSASITPNICSIYIKNGFNDFLEKPIDIFKLNNFLRTYLPRKYIVESKSISYNIKEFSEITIKNVDTKKAIQNCCGSLDNYLSLISVAYNDGKNKLKEIKNLANNKDFVNYTIEVHALKTVAALIGDTKLVQLSKRHEIAGTNNDLIFILENVDSLLSSYDELLNNIKLVLPKESLVIKEKNKNFTNQDLYALAKSTANAIDNFDLDAINEALNHLLHYDLSESQISTLNKVKSFINIFDYDNAYEAISTFKYSLGLNNNF